LANEAYANALSAQQQGNWADYGKYLDQLAQYLAQMLPEQAPVDPAAATIPVVPISEEGAADLPLE
ncbi:MAG: hypothetical protein RRY35_04795, partial [Clostridiales bacterium]